MFIEHLLISSMQGCFNVSDARRADRGRYTISARNTAGVATTTFRIHVRCRSPATPSGPILATDITAGGCKLRWGAPEDDGGSDVIGYAVWVLKLGQSLTMGNIQFTG